MSLYKIFRMIRIFLIILIFFIQNFAHSNEIKWKLEKTIEHGSYYENYGTAIKKVKINGKKKKLKFELREFFPIETVKNEKEGRCRKWRIQEKTFEGNLVEKSYSLNDCLPCIDKGAGYICSYPYFEIFYLTDLYGKYIDPRKKILSTLDELKSDGTKEINMYINLSSREKLHLIKRYIKLSTGLEIANFQSRIIKFNTKLRKIPSESTNYKSISGEESGKFKLVFNRLIDKSHNFIDNKNELKIREKDFKILFTVEPSATLYKFQTRD